MKLKLTDYETGLAIYVEQDAIKSARQLPAEVFCHCLNDDVPNEHGMRTKIDTATDMFFVRETVEEVME